MLLHKIELVVVDFENCGIDDLKVALTASGYILKYVNTETTDAEIPNFDSNILNQISASPEDVLNEYQRHKI